MYSYTIYRDMMIYDDQTLDLWVPLYLEVQTMVFCKRSLKPTVCAGQETSLVDTGTAYRPYRIWQAASTSLVKWRNITAKEKDWHHLASFLQDVQL